MQFVRGIGENGRIASTVVQVRTRKLRNTYWQPHLAKYEIRLSYTARLYSF